MSGLINDIEISDALRIVQIRASEARKATKKSPREAKYLLADIDDRIGTLRALLDPELVVTVEKRNEVVKALLCE